MEKEKFNQIINVLDRKIKQCKEVIITDMKDFDNLTIKDARDRVSRARHLHSDTDKIVSCELYHVLGMGDLTVTQQSKFIKRIKEIGRLRAYLKTMACYQIATTPTMPDEGEYECSTLGVKLVSKIKK